jgi:hypothetical protein
MRAIRSRRLVLVAAAKVFPVPQVVKMQAGYADRLYRAGPANQLVEVAAQIGRPLGTVNTNASGSADTPFICVRSTGSTLAGRATVRSRRSHANTVRSRCDQHGVGRRSARGGGK